MSEETKTAFTNKPTNRGFERIEFKDQYGIDCSIQALSLATEECIWFGCSKLELKGFRPGSGWVDLDADSLGFSHLQGNTRMHLTREQVGEVIPFLQTFYLDGKIEYRDDDVTEIKEVVGNALSMAKEITQLRAELTAERERREAAERALEHYADERNWGQQPGTSYFAQYTPGGWISGSGFTIAQEALAAFKESK